MTCSICLHWKIIPTHGSDKGDNAMQLMGYRNCAKDKTRFGAMKFIYGESSKCDKYEVKK